MPLNLSNPTVKAISQLRMRLAERQKWSPLSARQTISAAGIQVPSQRFAKEIIKLGDYIKLADNLAFTVTPESLQHWVTQFDRMQKNGKKIPIPATHKDKKWEARALAGDPRDNMGWVNSMYIAGGSLWMTCTLSGEEAIEAAKNADVSIHCPPADEPVVDGKGNMYVQPITHVAMCTNPLVPGLGEFIPLAASLRLQQEQKTMDTEFLKQLAAAVGLDPNALEDDEATMQAILTAVQNLAGTAQPAAPQPEEAEAALAAGPARAVQPAAAPAGRVMQETISRKFGVAASARPTTGAAAPAGAPAVGAPAGRFGVAASTAPAPVAAASPLLVSTICENRDLRLGNLVTAGKITPEQAEKLSKRWCSAEAISLTLASNGDGADFESVLEVLEMAEPLVVTGSKTGPQVSVSAGSPLVDTRKGTKPEKSELVADAQRRTKAAQKGWG